MKRKCLIYSLLFFFAWGLGGVWGCVPRHAPHSHMDGGLHVETIPSSRVTLSNITVRQEGRELIISGEISRRNTAFSGKGHVDMAVISPGGTLFHQAKTTYTPQILPKTPGARKHRPSRFEVRFSRVPPHGSVLRVAYHGKHEPDDLFVDDEDNYAIPEDYDHGG